MREITRREVVLGGALTVLHATCACGVAHAQGSVAGCWIPQDQASGYIARATDARVYANGSERMEPRSGNAALDRALAQALAKIARTFEVLPAFTYLDDGNQPNAYATAEAMLDRTDGTVMFGLGFLKMLLARPERPDASIVAVCAHEFGHILSYKNGMIRQLAPTRGAPFRGEQFADFMAGYFAGTRKLEHADYPAVVFATTQRYFGGGDHGSGEQRGAAVQAGFLAGYQRRMSIGDAQQTGFNYAMAQSL
ncbi:MAG: metalloprotease [Pseudomonadota bacterium]